VHVVVSVPEMVGPLQAHEQIPSTLLYYPPLIGLLVARKMHYRSTFLRPSVLVSTTVAYKLAHTNIALRFSEPTSHCRSLWYHRRNLPTVARPGARVYSDLPPTSSRRSQALGLCPTNARTTRRHRQRYTEAPRISCTLHAIEYQSSSPPSEKSSSSDPMPKHW